MKKVLVILAISIAFIGCTDADKAKRNSIGSDHLVQLINCDGSITHSWISSGKVYSEQTSGGIYFMDSNTEELVQVSGTVLITKIDE